MNNKPSKEEILELMLQEVVEALTKEGIVKPKSKAIPPEKLPRHLDFSKGRLELTMKNGFKTLIRDGEVIMKNDSEFERLKKLLETIRIDHVVTREGELVKVTLYEKFVEDMIESSQYESSG